MNDKRAIDPVCGMEVDALRTPYKTIYRGRLYHFCSLSCKKLFESNPEYYLTQGPRGMPKT